jgi:hypothetical protein
MKFILFIVVVLCSSFVIADDKIRITNDHFYVRVAIPQSQLDTWIEIKYDDNQIILYREDVKIKDHDINFVNFPNEVRELKVDKRYDIVYVTIPINLLQTKYKRVVVRKNYVSIISEQIIKIEDGS